MAKKALKIILTILGAGCLVGAYIIHYFAERKLGMVRWLNFQVAQYKKAMPVDTIEIVAIWAVVLLFLITAFLLYKNRKQLKPESVLPFCILALAAAVTVFLFFSPDFQKPSERYFLEACTSLGALCAFVACLLR
ncbi:MAG: hypothetical protein Q3982_07030 [Phoenicibacter congonensis]|uniref:Uncharacterized protein n=1 Tax=Phoenicibacter congonensis TaxID=1944646 RepID=A0AA43RIM1_9ACTN|nr:hypothetical protein [Phoenicibacter congonensis]